MPGFIGAIGRTLFVLLGLISEKKQEPKVWNRFAEFSILISKDSQSSQELVFRKDNIILVVKDDKDNKKISCAFSGKHQAQLITCLEKNKFFYLASCEKNKISEIKIKLTYTKDHFRKQVCYPSGKKDNTRIENILKEVQSIAKENNLNCSVSASPGN